MNPGLQSQFKNIRQKLSRAAGSSGGPLSLPVVTTLDPDQNSPSGRIVILRKVEFEYRFIDFHTDIRSNKVEELKANNSLSFVFYEPQELEQIRIWGTAEIHHKNETARKEWNDLGPGSKKIYSISKPPGETIDDPDEPFPSFFGSKELESDQLEDGYQNFCCVRCSIDHVDWLKIERHRHLRAQFDYSVNDGSFSGGWLVP